MADKLSQNQLDTIVKQLRSGNKIGAVKLYREITGLGLYEAKTAVDSIQLELTGGGSANEAKQAGARIGTPTQIPQDQLDKIAAELTAGNMPGAIQLYRQLTGSSEFVAKAEIEALASKLNLTSYNGSSGLNQSKGCLGTAAALAIMGLAILYKTIGA